MDRAYEELALDMTRFEWAQVVAFDDAAQQNYHRRVLDTPPSKLRLGLAAICLAPRIDLRGRQTSSFAVKKREGAVLRDEGKSNTFEAMPQTTRRKRLVRRAERERVYLVVHRYDGTCFTTSGSILRPLPFCRDCKKARDSGKSLRCRTRENDPNRHRLDPANSGMVSRLVCPRLVFQSIDALVEKFYRWLIALGSTLRSPLLLAVRLFWGWQFLLTGKGKLIRTGENHAILRRPRNSLPSCSGRPGRQPGMLRRIASAHRFGYAADSIPLMILLLSRI